DLDPDNCGTGRSDRRIAVPEPGPDDGPHYSRRTWGVGVCGDCAARDRIQSAGAFALPGHYLVPICAGREWFDSSQGTPDGELPGWGVLEQDRRQHGIHGSVLGLSKRAGITAIPTGRDAGWIQSRAR